MTNLPYKHHFAGDGIAWIQPDGPNTKPVPLGCHDIGDVDQALGDVTIYYCPDLSTVNRWNTVGSYQGAKGPVTTTFETHVADIKDELEKIFGCGSPLYLHKVRSGRRDVFARYARTYIIPTMRITNHTLTSMGSKSPEDQSPSMQSFSVSGDDKHPAFELAGQRQETAETEALNTIWSCNPDQCWDALGGARDLCEDLIAGGDALAGSASNQADVIKQEDGDGEWAADGHPFGAGYDIAALRCFPMGRSTTRWIALNGTTQALNPAQVSISDDGGVTWTQYNVGAVNGQYFMGHRSIWNKGSTIWVCTTGGYIYKSTDGGVTWAAQEEGILSGGGDLNVINGVDEYTLMACGDTDVILITNDGITWTATATVTGTGDDITACARLTKYRMWVGTSSGEMWYTHDMGGLWSERTEFAGTGTGAIADMAWVEHPVLRVFCGYFIHNSAAPVGTLFHTINGGYDWEETDLPDNDGLNAIFLCDCNSGFVVGEPESGTAFIARFAGG